jgi:DNA polymerase III alpha subunit
MPTTPDPAATPDPWQAIAALVAWLDAHNGTGQQETALRLLKVTEEAGEAASAYIGATGQNPRKGTTHTPADVADELCDVIVSAMVALHSFTDQPARHLTAKLTAVTERACSEDLVTVADLLTPGPPRREATVTGTVTEVEERVSGAGYPWASVTFTDATGSIRVLFFPKTWDHLHATVVTGLRCTVTGWLNAGDDETALIGNTVTPVIDRP